VIRALFLDVDGTLLNSSRKISPATLEALLACRDKGVDVFVATARPPTLGRSIGLNQRELACLDSGGVFNNGGCLIYSHQKTYYPMDEAVVSGLLKTAFVWPEVNIALQMEGEFHAMRTPLLDYTSWGVTGDEVLPIAGQDLSRVIKMLLFSKTMDMQVLERDVLAAHADAATIYLTGRPGAQFLEVVGHGISKRSGVERLIEFAHLSPDEIAVFGDDRNDIEMLSAFPNSVAMGNASGEVKQVARHVTLTNDEDGIVYALRHILRVI
jgi:Cof subfamily protein (haloacid dehalogenase superfamily)